MTRVPHDTGSARAATVNPLRGEFAAVLAGERIAFDTSLETVALIEERCGGVPIVEVIERAVFGRRATDLLALVAGALAALGRPDAEAVAGRTASVEAEAFVLALMAALGFEVARKAPPAGEGGSSPFAPAPVGEVASAPTLGDGGAPSRSAP